MRIWMKVIIGVAFAAIIAGAAYVIFIWSGESYIGIYVCIESREGPIDMIGPHYTVGDVLELKANWEAIFLDQGVRYVTDASLDYTVEGNKLTLKWIISGYPVVQEAKLEDEVITFPNGTVFARERGL